MDVVLSALDREFVSLDALSRELLQKLTNQQLFFKPSERPMFSCGEYLIRSAAVVEKTFDGITTRLWDDPFEWTLPEKLADRASILQYFDEVEITRRKGFDYFTSDEELLREMPAPEQLRRIIEILLETLTHAAHFQGRAFAVFQFISDERLPRF